MKFRELTDEYRRWGAEILLVWVIRLYPVSTAEDHAFTLAIVAAVEVAVANLQRRAAVGDATAKPSKTGSTR